jgi:hypothetical protein
MSPPLKMNTIPFNVYRNATATDIIIPNDYCNAPEQKLTAIIR